MFERGPNGYWFEWTLVDEGVFLALGGIMVILGFRFITVDSEKWEGFAPIAGLFLFMPGWIMFLGTILSLFGVAM